MKAKPKKPEWLKSKPPKSKRITLDFIHGKTDKPNQNIKK
jgi:hypothetical protein